MNAPLTRRALLGATAAIGATVAMIPASAATDPDAGLLDLIRRHAEADAAYDPLGIEVERCRVIALAAHPDRPQALQIREDDFPRTGLGVGLSDGEGDGPRWYGFRGVD